MTQDITSLIDLSELVDDGLHEADAQDVKTPIQDMIGVINDMLNGVQTHDAIKIGSTVFAEGDIGGGSIAIEENDVSVVAAADVINVVEMNVEDAGSNQANIYLNLPSLFNARLTISTGVPYPSSTVTAATSVFLTALETGNEVTVYDGTRLRMYRLTSDAEFKITNVQNGTTVNGSAVITGLTDTSQFVTGMKVTGTGIAANSTVSSIDSATQVTLNNNATASGTVSLTFKIPAATVIDLYVYVSSGTLKLSPVKWSTATTKPTRQMNNGFLTKNSTATHRFVGTIQVDPLTDGQIEQVLGVVGGGASPTKPKLLIDNFYNRQPISIIFDVEDNHTLPTNTLTFRPYKNDSTTNRGFICLMNDTTVINKLAIQASGVTTGSEAGYIGLGVDATNTITDQSVSIPFDGRLSTTNFPKLTAGGHTLYLLEASLGDVSLQNCTFVIYKEY